MSKFAGLGRIDSEQVRSLDLKPDFRSGLSAEIDQS
jgi:hypothetical protein